jgi:hypothetical protein
LSFGNPPGVFQTTGVFILRKYLTDFILQFILVHHLPDWLGYGRFWSDDIIASKVAANRVKDRESLPRLRSFRTYWMQKYRSGGII